MSLILIILMMLPKLLTELVPERDGVISMVRGGGGNVRVMLVNPKERKRTQQEIADQLECCSEEKDKSKSNGYATINFWRKTGRYAYSICSAGNIIDKLRKVLPAFMAKVMDDPMFQMADVNLKFTKPELRIHIDREKASALGVSTQNIGQTLQLALSGQRFGYFFMNGKQYQILGDLARSDRNKPLDLKSLYVRNNYGDMIQFDNLVTLTEETAPPQLNRYNRFVSATISAGLAKGKTISQGLDEMDKICKRGT